MLSGWRNLDATAVDLPDSFPRTAGTGHDWVYPTEWVSNLTTFLASLFFMIIETPGVLDRSFLQDICACCAS